MPEGWESPPTLSAEDISIIQSQRIDEKRVDDQDSSKQYNGQPKMNHEVAIYSYQGILSGLEHSDVQYLQLIIGEQAQLL